MNQAWSNSFELYVNSKRDFSEKEEAIMFSMSLQGNQVASANRARFESWV